MVASEHVVRIVETVRTPMNFYIFLQLCNGGDLKELMVSKSWKVTPKIVHQIMS